MKRTIYRLSPLEHIHFIFEVIYCYVCTVSNSLLHSVHTQVRFLCVFKHTRIPVDLQNIFILSWSSLQYMENYPKKCNSLPKCKKNTQKESLNVHDTLIGLSTVLILTHDPYAQDVIHTAIFCLDHFFTCSSFLRFYVCQTYSIVRCHIYKVK